MLSRMAIQMEFITKEIKTGTKKSVHQESA